MTTTRARPQRRDISGILLLDKPAGLTSNAALQRVKALFDARKAGHTGSLDPLATGLLPLCFGHATKLSSYLLDADKRYRFSCRLGAVTDTGDAEGRVVERPPLPPALDAPRIDATLARFEGTSEQLPPMYSALKHRGRRLYELAREGVEVERKPRTITVYALRRLDFGADFIDCEVRCSKGTYVRTLAEDIGLALGSGAHVSALRRTAAAPYDVDQAVTLAELERRAAAGGDGYAALDALLLAPDSALAAWPSLRLDDTLSYYLRRGSPVQVRDAPDAGRVRLYDAAQTFIGIGEILPDGRVAPRRLFVG